MEKVNLQLQLALAILFQPKGEKNLKKSCKVHSSEMWSHYETERQLYSHWAFSLSAHLTTTLLKVNLVIFSHKKGRKKKETKTNKQKPKQLQAH